MPLIIHNTELPRRHSLYRPFGMNDIRPFASLFERSGMILRRMPYLERHSAHLHPSGKKMEIADGECALICRDRLETVAYVKYVFSHIFFHRIPRPSVRTGLKFRL